VRGLVTGSGQVTILPMNSSVLTTAAATTPAARAE
jgi:hypothetical protein